MQKPSTWSREAHARNPRLHHRDLSSMAALQAQGHSVPARRRRRATRTSRSSAPVSSRPERVTKSPRTSAGDSVPPHPTAAIRRSERLKARTTELPTLTIPSPPPLSVPFTAPNASHASRIGLLQRSASSSPAASIARPPTPPPPPPLARAMAAVSEQRRSLAPGLGPHRASPLRSSLSAIVDASVLGADGDPPLVGESVHEGTQHTIARAGTDKEAHHVNGAMIRGSIWASRSLDQS